MGRWIDRAYSRLHRLFMPPGRQQNAVDRWVARLWTRFDVMIHRRLGWSASARLMGVDVVILETTGRRSGQRRETVVACVDLDGALVVGAGNWGWDRDPGWLYNLQAQPVVRVTRGRRTEVMTAVVLDGDAAVRAAEALATAYPHSQVYIKRRSRPVRVVRLTPTAARPVPGRKATSSNSILRDPGRDRLT